METFSDDDDLFGGLFKSDDTLLTRVGEKRSKSTKDLKHDPVAFDRSPVRAKADHAGDESLKDQKNPAGASSRRTDDGRRDEAGPHDTSDTQDDKRVNLVPIKPAPPGQYYRRTRKLVDDAAQDDLDEIFGDDSEDFRKAFEDELTAPGVAPEGREGGSQEPDRMASSSPKRRRRSRPPSVDLLDEIFPSP